MELPQGIELSSLRLVRYPAPVLSSPAREIPTIDDDVRALAEAMLKVMVAADGVGLAAPQVGVPARLFVANVEVVGDEHGCVYVNPRILERSGTELVEEGCLSLPGIHCKVKRSACVTIRAMGLDGREFTQRAEGLAARVFQHEIDHLDGTLIADRMSMVARLANRRTLKELAEDYRDAAGA